MSTRSTSFDDYMMEYLSDRKKLVTYLQVVEEEANEANDPEILRIAARRIIRLYGTENLQPEHLQKFQVDGVGLSAIQAIQAELYQPQEVPRIA